MGRFRKLLGLTVLASTIALSAAGPARATPAPMPATAQLAETALARLGARSDLPPEPLLLVKIVRPIAATARPGRGLVVGHLATGSKYYGTPIVAWVLKSSDDGRFGLVTLPWSGHRTGWIPLKGLARSRSQIVVRASLGRHQITVLRSGRPIFRLRAATGAPASPTPPGRYYVTDRVPFGAGSYLGSFAFGLSGIQPNLPPGWSGGNQLAIHGTDNPSSIGRSASAGCLRVSERGLALLKPLLRLGTPVVIAP